MSTIDQKVSAPRVSPTATNTVAAITEFTEHLLTYGFAYFDKRWYWDDPIAGMVNEGYLNAYAKQVCKEMHRPWVRAAGGWYTHWTAQHNPGTGKYERVDMGRKFSAHLTVPKKNYLAPIAAPLLMIASEDHSQPISSSHSKTNWEFYFQGESVAEVWDNHIHFMRTDPACRAALKLPTP